MSDSTDNSANDYTVNNVTSAQLDRIAANGMWTSPASIDQDAVNLCEALVAVLQGTAPQSVLTPELQQLVTQVQGVAGIGFPWIATGDGVKLSAHSIKLKTSEPRPVVIVPAGWTPFGWVLFEYAYLQLALRGYHVLGYTPRGIGYTVKIPGGGYIDSPFTSGGTIDVAGPKDWTDGSTVIDYAMRTFNPSKVAFLGESYGSGISQLVAAHDPEDRVAAVVALSTWRNLADALLQHDTRHVAAVQTLVDFTGGPIERKFDAETRELLDDFFAGQNLGKVTAWGLERSPESYRKETNTRGIPTFISNTWHETLFPVNQIVADFDELRVPKRLNLWIGDHAAPEGAGLSIPLSGPNVPVAEAFAWLDYHVLGAPNDVPTWQPVSSQVMFSPDVRESAASWSDVTTEALRLHLGRGTNGGDGTLGDAENTGWAKDFTAGEETEATAVDKIMTTGQQEWQGNPKSYATGKFDRQYVAVWTSEALPGGLNEVSLRVRGVPRVRLTVRSTAESTTLVAYLFDVAADNSARIITHEPYTLGDLTPDQDQTVEWALQAAAYDVAAGHRLMLVVGSEDQLYSNANVDGSTTIISSTDGDAAHLDVPLG